MAWTQQPSMLRLSKYKYIHIPYTYVYAIGCMYTNTAITNRYNIDVYICCYTRRATSKYHRVRARLRSVGSFLCACRACAALPLRLFCVRQSPPPPPPPMRPPPPLLRTSARACDPHLTGKYYTQFTSVNSRYRSSKLCARSDTHLNRYTRSHDTTNSMYVVLLIKICVRDARLRCAAVTYCFAVCHGHTGARL